MRFISAYFVIFLSKTLLFCILSELQIGLDPLGHHGLHSASLVITRCFLVSTFDSRAS